MSSYQADWYVDEEGEFEDDAEGDEDEEDDGDSITIGSIGRMMNPAQAIAEKKMMMTTIREQVLSTRNHMRHTINYAIHRSH